MLYPSYALRPSLLIVSLQMSCQFTLFLHEIHIVNKHLNKQLIVFSSLQHLWQDNRSSRCFTIFPNAPTISSLQGGLSSSTATVLCFTRFKTNIKHTHNIQYLIKVSPPSVLLGINSHTQSTILIVNCHNSSWFPSSPTTL